jgi:hypothetical protein
MEIETDEIWLCNFSLMRGMVLAKSVLFLEALVKLFIIQS